MRISRIRKHALVVIDEERAEGGRGEEEGRVKKTKKGRKKKKKKKGACTRTNNGNEKIMTSFAAANEMATGFARLSLRPGMHRSFLLLGLN